MWKRLSRLWTRAGSKTGDAPKKPSGPERLAAAGSQAVEATPPPPPAPPRKDDPLVGLLARFDAELRELGAGAVVPRIRDLLIKAPADPRVLRRAGEQARMLGDEELAAEFDQAVASAGGSALAELGHSFLAMDDPELALVFGDGAVRRAKRGSHSDEGAIAGRLIGALALSRMGEHAQVLARLEHALDDGVAARVRWALAALALGDDDALGRVIGELGPAEPWIDEVRARVEAFPSASEGFSNDPQRLLFSLYGTVLLDDADAGERLEPERLVRWVMALATLVREVLPAGTRPTWVSPRGEVLARWLASYLDDAQSAMPLSARLPQQPVLVVLADDNDLAGLVETRGWDESVVPIFQAIKDPNEIGSPMADVIGVFRGDVTLPLEALEAERAQDRQPPKMLLGQLLDLAAQKRVDPQELDGFLGWVRARKELLALARPLPGAGRIPLDVARDL